MRTTVFFLAFAIALGGCKSKSTDDSATTSAGPTTDRSGNYTITSAKNPNGNGAYKGTVSIDKRADVYRVHWTIPGSPPFQGVAIDTGSSLGVGWGRGRAYGVVVYKIDGGTLHGTWANHDSDKLGIEDLSGPPGLSGDYEITKASAPGGSGAYTGKVRITPTGSTYAVAWQLTGGDSYAGVGIKDGNKLVVGWGTTGSEAGVVNYQYSGAGFVGSWATPGGTQLGIENLSKN